MNTLKTFKKFCEDGGAGAGGAGVAGTAASASGGEGSAPANNAGSGQIAGIGIGPHGEPGVDPEVEKRRRKYKSGY